MKYLGVRIDSKLNWKAHIDDIAIKLIRANALLYKARDFVNKGILKSIYFALFDSHINYASIIWGQNINTINRLFLLQKKAIRTINFKERRAHTNPLFKNSNILKLHDKIKIANCLLISSYVHNKLPSIFNNWFTFSSNFHQYETSLPQKIILKFQVLKQLLMEKVPSLAWVSRHGMVSRK